MPSRRAKTRTRPAVRIVADVGNSRIKWGLCDKSTVAKSAVLSPDDPRSWRKQLDDWKITGAADWAVGGVHPGRRDELVTFLRQQGWHVDTISSHAQLGLKINVANPENVGIDRLLNAVAVNTRRGKNEAAVIVDAGSAVTVDYVDADGTFRGGAIMPGARLMARALHENTALLPLVDLNGAYAMPGDSTADAIRAGVACAIIGGVKELIAALKKHESIAKGPRVFVGGGDGGQFAEELGLPAQSWPLMTLEGLRIAAWPAEDE